ncbi:MAG: hypothetical protein A3G81_09295 [Betaproteobacteria bacterium RIFCSPLOWO2_12_FULL_65_14]|nr:MAG: hypothetical protein A3G81_09295 [Betaproteobacteria bacterium RIFCSPLOWO2_12_FULL_65_14]
MTVGGCAVRQRVLFLDDDPAVRLMRALTLRRMPPEIRDWLPDYIWPEILREPQAYLAALRAKSGWPDDAEGIHVPDPARLSAEELASITAIVFRRGRIDRALLDALPNLRVIQRFSRIAPELDDEVAGEVAARGIVVCVFPRSSLTSVVEHAMALLLAVMRRLRELDMLTRSGVMAPCDRAAQGPIAYNWSRFADVPLVGGSKAGIVGLGDVGAEIARLLSAFGAEVSYCNRKQLPASRERGLGVQYLPLRSLLSRVDIVVLTATPSADSSPIIGSQELAAMRPTTVLINVARGSLVDEAALIRALEDRRIAGAGLDVYAREPLPATSPLTRLPNVILTPHMAGQTRMRLFEEVSDIAANVAAALRGERPLHRVQTNRDG